MLKIKFADETAETNPFVNIWASQGEAAPEGVRIEHQGTAGYVFMMAVSGLTCLLALLLSGYGLYQITRPTLSLAEGLSLASLGGIAVVGSSVAMQLIGGKIARILRQRRSIAEAIKPSPRRP